VILVESSQGAVDVEMSRASRLFHHAGKRSIQLALAEPRAWDQVRALALGADVLLEGEAPGTMAGRGMSYAELAASNPALVVTSITPFGQSGPYAHYAANDLVVFAMGGVMFISGEPDRPPVVAPDQQAYVTAGTHAAFATLAALWARRQDGTGDWVDVSMFECLVAQENTITNYLEPGSFARRAGSQHRTSLPGRIFQCRDGYIHLFISRELPVWQRFVDWLGNPPELSDPSWADINTRWEHADVVNEVTEAFVATRTRAELFVAGQGRHLPVVPVNPPLNYLEDAQISVTSPTIQVRGTRADSYTTLRPPSYVSAGPTGAPEPGEHTGQILRECLGLDDTQVDALHSAGLL
jgi:crotonobetainyl-CoA:carnitine CoA-transferase CaiB-like acyl-CoA transferase